MDELIPESITGNNTQALDRTYLERLVNMGVKQLSIDFAGETDMTKVSLWLEQFGVPMELLPDDLDKFTLQDLLPLMVRIYKLSGTDLSIELLAKALGADKAEVIRDSFLLDHSSQALYDGWFHYDAGREYRSFAIDVKLWGVVPAKRREYESTFRKLHDLFEPLNVHLRTLIFE